MGIRTAAGFALLTVGWVGVADAQTPSPPPASPKGADSQGQVVANPLPYGAATANNNNNTNAFAVPPGVAEVPPRPKPVARHAE